MKIIKEIFNKNREVLLYIFFGGITTFINIATYYICYNMLGYPNVFSNVIAWIFSVVFAFISNKLWVFESKSLNVSNLFKEFILFMSIRILTGIIDTGIMYFGVDVLKYNGLVMKILSNLIVLVTNYIGSKFFIFRNKDKINK